MSITAKELAQLLNLSTASVSVALNGKPGVSTATRKRILTAAHEYGYDFSAPGWFLDRRILNVSIDKKGNIQEVSEEYINKP